MEPAPDNPESDWADIELELSMDALDGRQRTLDEYRRRYPEYASRFAAAYERGERDGDGRALIAAPVEGDRIGPYQLGRVLGTGGQGVVLEATDTRLGRKVALKFLHATSLFSHSRRDRFRREAEVISRLGLTEGVIMGHSRPCFARSVSSRLRRRSSRSNPAPATR